jgi:carbon monoxide dehydrogenase subunit G
MQFENSFDVPLPAPQAWKTLMDIERIVRCLPGAELTDKIDDRTYKGKVSVRLGPVALSFAGTASFEEIDDATRHARVKASGIDQKGRGGANAVTSFSVEPAAEGSRVVVKTDLNLSGSVAQYGRGAGMIQEVAQQLIGQFAANLRRQLAAETAASAPVATRATTAVPQPGPQPPVKPISGFRLFALALWGRFRRLLGRGGVS